MGFDVGRELVVFYTREPVIREKRAEGLTADLPTSLDRSSLLLLAFRSSTNVRKRCTIATLLVYDGAPVFTMSTLLR